MAVTLDIDNEDAPYVVEHYRATFSGNTSLPHTLIVKRMAAGSSPESAIIVWLSDDDVAALIQSMLQE